MSLEIDDMGKRNHTYGIFCTNWHKKPLSSKISCGWPKLGLEIRILKGTYFQGHFERVA